MHTHTHTHTETLNIHALSGIRTTIPASERAKTVHALDRSATVTGGFAYLDKYNWQAVHGIEFLGSMKGEEFFDLVVASLRGVRSEIA
jgi:hypothetical protein